MKYLDFIGLALILATTAASADERQQLVDTIKAVGGTVEFSRDAGNNQGSPVAISLYDGNNPLKGKGGLNTTVNDNWLSHLDGLTTVTKLDLANCDIHKAGLRHVATLVHLENLNLTLTPTVDDDLEPLATLTKLTAISLASTHCTGEGFRNLKGLTKLSNLNMHYTPVNDAGLAAIAEVGVLERLWVVHAHFTNAAGPSLAAHRHLKRLGLGSKEKTSSGAIVASLKDLLLTELELFDEQATDEGVINASAISTLRMLNVSYSPTVTDAALDAVAQMPGLEEFKLSGAKVTDAGLMKLAGLKSLKKVVLGQMKLITPRGIAALGQARPDLAIESP